MGRRITGPELRARIKLTLINVLYSHERVYRRANRCCRAEYQVYGHIRYRWFRAGIVVYSPPAVFSTFATSAIRTKYRTCGCNESGTTERHDNSGA